MSQPQTESQKLKYLRVADVRRRYGGVSDMWVARKTSDLGFPAPVFFGGRDRFWVAEELDAWDARMISRGSERAKPTPPRKTAR